MPRRFSSFATSAGALANNPMFKGLSKLTDEMKKIEGITLAESTSVKFMGQSNQSSKEAIEVKKGTAMVNDAKLVKTDIETANGVIHVIDKVLMPTENLSAAKH